MVVDQTASVEVVASFPASAQEFSASARSSGEVDRVEVVVTDAAGTKIGESVVLTKSGGQYRGKIVDLPLGKELTFKASATAGGTEIFHGSATHTFDNNQWEVTIAIELRPNNEEISLPGIKSISYPRQVILGTSVAVRFEIINGSSTSYAIAADDNGGSFVEASGNVPDNGIVDATYTANDVAGTFGHAIAVTNTAGDVVTAHFEIKHAEVAGAVEISFYPTITKVKVDHQSNGTIKIEAFGQDDENLPADPYEWKWTNKDGDTKASEANPVEITSFDSNKALSVSVTDKDSLKTSVKVASVSAVTTIEFPYTIEITQGSWSDTCYSKAHAQLAAKGFYLGKDAETVTDQVVWKSSDTQVVTVDDNGKVQAVAGGGSATVTASLGSTSSISVQTPDGACFLITYNGNEAISGSVPVDSTSYGEGRTVTVLGNTGNLARTGYSFIGWNTKADGNGASYEGSDTFTMGAANVTLYAQWEHGLRDDLLRCGNSGRDVALFIPEGVDLEVLASCEPDENTQAVLVTRSGKDSFDGNDLRDWVKDGGVVLTEWSSSDEVYNAVFGSVVYESGSMHGGCHDFAPTVVQFNSDDLFWQENAWQQEASPGCGRSDVGSWPGVVALAGWDADTVAIGYRDHGQGRVWLTEFDWQDYGHGSSADRFAYSASLLGYMITHRAE